MKLFLSVFVISILSIQTAIGQDKKEELGGAAYQQKYRINIHKAQKSIKIDGIHQEDDWKGCDVISDFKPHWPQDNVPLKRATEVMLTYDAQFLYIAAVCYDTSYHVIQTLKRDASFWDSDSFMFVVDPVNEKTNGFIFNLSPANVQSEDVFSGDAFGDLTGSWDNKWYSETKVYKDRWTVEMAIPFKTLRFDPAKKEWGINFIRSDLKNNQYSTWTFIPVNFEGYSLGYTGAMVWDQPPPSVKGNVSLIPFMTGGVSKDKESVDKKSKQNIDAGLDAKVAITPSMNLDLTLNPDFSQIEVDRQVTNLTRFNIFFPERRTFFLENSDLFGNYGAPPFRPFFSRRIGLDANNQPVHILGGARLSGNVSKTTRIGVMNMQTRGRDDTPAQNFTAASFQQRVLARSSVKGYFLNTQNFLDDTQRKANPMSQYGRNQGLEFSYVNQSGAVNVWTGQHFSQKPTLKGANGMRQYGGAYFGRNVNFLADYAEVGTNYYADMGFVNRIENYTYVLDKSNKSIRDTMIRLGYQQLYSELGYTIRPKNSKIISHSFSTEHFVVWNPNGSLNERTHDLSYRLMFKNTSQISVAYSFNDVRALFAFSFTDSDFPLLAGKYVFNQWRIRYNSDYRKLFYYSASTKVGQFYNGTLQSYNFDVTYRVQPWGNFSLSFEQNDVKLSEKYGNDRLLLISPRIEINFSNAIFWTTFLQFNTQRNNFNVNSRLQWRYKPMSDLFLVYTDNYYTDPLFKNKSRGVVFKLNYWFTL
jgi:Domain of unknown function (DUF5916)/Carbohydrate family 9 binding domain-like